MRKVAAVIGKPVLHSASPLLHNAALSGFDGRYLRLAVDEVSEALRLMNEMGLEGLNVTAPFKEEAYRLLKHKSLEAEKTKSVNTIVGEFGYNTDCFGITNSLEGVDKSEVLILGAGGAARAAVYALTGSSITVMNRTLERAEALASEFGVVASDLSKEAQSKHFKNSRLIINCTSTTERLIDPQFLSKEHTLLESQYSKPTALLLDLKAKGGKVIDGYQWLLNQASEAFSLFYGHQTNLPTLQSGLKNQRVKSGKPIVLGGLMGAGKTVVGRRLAEVLGFRFIDIDQEIESKLGKSVTEIFSSEGEKRFREIESEVLKEALLEEKTVISTGGGIVLDGQNRHLLSEKSLFIWLWASQEEIAHRLKGDKTRPLLEGYDLVERLQEILSQRKKLYEELCEIVIPTGGHSIDSIADRIIYEIGFTR